MMLSQTKEYQDPLKLEEARKDSLLELSVRVQSSHHLDCQLLASRTVSHLVYAYFLSSPRKLIYHIRYQGQVSGIKI